MRQSELTDTAEIDELVREFFAAFSNEGGICPKLERLEGLFLPSAVIVKALDPEPEVYSLRGFIAPRAALLRDGTLTEFREEEETARTLIVGNVAQRISLYRKRGCLSGKRFEGRGIKVLQLVRTPAGWRISALSWDDEREGLTIPEAL